MGEYKVKLYVYNLNINYNKIKIINITDIWYAYG